jgi:hypothetical protein
MATYISKTEKEKELNPNPAPRSRSQIQELLYHDVPIYFTASRNIYTAKQVTL